MEIHRLTQHSSTQQILLSLRSPNAPCQLHILGHDRDSLGVQRTEIAILKEPDEMRFGCLLKGQQGRGLPSEEFRGHVGLDFADEAGERELAEEEVGAFLVLANFAEGTFAWTRSE